MQLCKVPVQQYQMTLEPDEILTTLFESAFFFATIGFVLLGLGGIGHTTVLTHEAHRSNVFQCF